MKITRKYPDPPMAISLQHTGLCRRFRSRHSCSIDQSINQSINQFFIENQTKQYRISE